MWIYGRNLKPNTDYTLIIAENDGLGFDLNRCRRPVGVSQGILAKATQTKSSDANGKIIEYDFIDTLELATDELDTVENQSSPIENILGYYVLIQEANNDTRNSLSLCAQITRTRSERRARIYHKNFL